jgi:hypothetical protein
MFSNYSTRVLTQQLSTLAYEKKESTTKSIKLFSRKAAKKAHYFFNPENDFAIPSFKCEESNIVILKDISEAKPNGIIFYDIDDTLILRSEFDRTGIFKLNCKTELIKELELAQTQNYLVMILTARGFNPKSTIPIIGTQDIINSIGKDYFHGAIFTNGNHKYKAMLLFQNEYQLPAYKLCLLDDSYKYRHGCAINNFETIDSYADDRHAKILRFLTAPSAPEHTAPTPPTLEVINHRIWPNKRPPAAIVGFIGYFFSKISPSILSILLKELYQKNIMIILTLLDYHTPKKYLSILENIEAIPQIKKFLYGISFSNGMDQLDIYASLSEQYALDRSAIILCVTTELLFDKCLRHNYTTLYSRPAGEKTYLIQPYLQNLYSIVCQDPPTLTKPNPRLVTLQANSSKKPCYLFSEKILLNDTSALTQALTTARKLNFLLILIVDLNYNSLSRKLIENNPLVTLFFNYVIYTNKTNMNILLTHLKKEVLTKYQSSKAYLVDTATEKRKYCNRHNLKHIHPHSFIYLHQCNNRMYSYISSPVLTRPKIKMELSHEQRSSLKIAR